MWRVINKCAIDTSFSSLLFKQIKTCRDIFLAPHISGRTVSLLRMSFRLVSFAVSYFGTVAVYIFWVGLNVNVSWRTRENQNPRHRKGYRLNFRKQSKTDQDWVEQIFSNKTRLDVPTRNHTKFQNKKILRLRTHFTLAGTEIDNRYFKENRLIVCAVHVQLDCTFATNSKSSQLNNFMNKNNSAGPRLSRQQFQDHAGENEFKTTSCFLKTSRFFRFLPSWTQKRHNGCTHTAPF